MVRISEQIREIAEIRGWAESTVCEEALQRGIEELWEEVKFSQYFDGEIDRDELLQVVSEGKLERAERERRAVEDDVDWGLRS